MRAAAVTAKPSRPPPSAGRRPSTQGSGDAYKQNRTSGRGCSMRAKRVMNGSRPGAACGRKPGEPQVHADRRQEQQRVADDKRDHRERQRPTNDAHRARMPRRHMQSPRSAARAISNQTRDAVRRARKRPGTDRQGRATAANAIANREAIEASHRAIRTRCPGETRSLLASDVGDIIGQRPKRCEDIALVTLSECSSIPYCVEITTAISRISMESSPKRSP